MIKSRLIASGSETKLEGVDPTRLEKALVKQSGEMAERDELAVSEEIGLGGQVDNSAAVAEMLSGNTAEVVPDTATEITEDLAREAMAIIDSVPKPKANAPTRAYADQQIKIFNKLKQKYPWLDRESLAELQSAVNNLR